MLNSIIRARGIEDDHDAVNDLWDEYFSSGIKVDICTINMNEGEGRQTIYWDTNDKLLHTSYDGSECYGIKCNTVEEAWDLAYDLWFRTTIGWNPEWCDR